MEALPDIYPLTGLQIGDIQSYISRAFLYFAPLSRKIYVLVDNRPWLISKQSRSARLWQLMVTKYRMSPFMNSRALQKVPSSENTNVASDGDGDENLKKYSRRRWFAMMDLSKALHGFLVFEVSWRDVHGINYLNELQTDTSFAIEVRYMKKWEFHSPEQAANCISLWFLGRITEAQTLKSYLRKLSDLDFHPSDAQSFSQEMVLRRTSSLQVVSEKEFLDVPDQLVDTDVGKERDDTKDKSLNHFNHDFLEMLGSSPCEEKKPFTCKEMEDPFVAPSQYSDTLILFRFTDGLLPFKLRQIIMSDIRLLTLLESGLPSWVIFFQSYPLFCHFYRPWMRPLARSLYILASLVTVIIGFYDLYKNVPLLKATAARICGPLFSWIETWDMVTRIQYLGTILFLRNLRKCIRWLVTLVRAAKTLLRAVSAPFAGPLAEVAELIAPLVSSCGEICDLFCSTAWSAVGCVWNWFVDLAEIMWSPCDMLFDYFCTIVASFYPLLEHVFDLFLVPIRCAATLASYTGSLLSNSYNFLKDIWETISSIFELNHMSEAQQSAFDISMLKGLWNDLFSQVFRAIRSIVNGLLAFFASCNRHRLSIYNYMQSVLQHLLHIAGVAPYSCQCKLKRRLGQHNEDDAMECTICK